jgi:predicted CopG family antitoxin
MDPFTVNCNIPGYDHTNKYEVVLRIKRGHKNFSNIMFAWYWKKNTYLIEIAKLLVMTYMHF